MLYLLVFVFFATAATELNVAVAMLTITVIALVVASTRTVKAVAGTLPASGAGAESSFLLAPAAPLDSLCVDILNDRWSLGVAVKNKHTKDLLDKKSVAWKGQT